MLSEATWSFLDPKPLQVYYPKYGAHLTFWNGVATTRTYALMIFSSIWLNNFPTHSQKDAAWDEFVQLYKMGCFGTRSWDGLLLNHIDPSNFPNVLSRMINKNSQNPMFLSSLKETHDAKTALTWFMPSKEITASS